jgi:hypothetical protein
LFLLIIPPWKKKTLALSFFLGPFLIPPNVAEEKPLKGCDRKRGGGGERGRGWGEGGRGRGRGLSFIRSEGLQRILVYFFIFFVKAFFQPSSYTVGCQYSLAELCTPL